MRQSERVLLRVPIEVSGKGPDGNVFSEKAFTLVINRHGAQIRLRNALQPNDRVTITNLQSTRSCLFRVVARVEQPFSDGPEWGVECLEPDANFWGLSFPEKRISPGQQDQQELIHALLECSVCHFSELAEITIEQYHALTTQSSLSRRCVQCKKRTEWNFGSVEGAPEEVPTSEETRKSLPPEVGTRINRRARRLTIKLPVRVSIQDGREEVMRTENLSVFGVCLVSTFTMKEGERLTITLSQGPDGLKQEVSARVVWRKSIQGTNRAIYGLELEKSD